MSFLSSENWPLIRKRYEAFWHGEVIDRPLLWVTAPGAAPAPAEAEDHRPAKPEDYFDWMTDPQRVLPRLQRQITRVHCSGDAFPLVFPASTLMPAIQAAFLGGDYRIHNGTGWCHPVLDWKTRKPLIVDPRNIWWQRTQELLRQGAEAFADLAVIGIPDLQGGGQILDLLRGTEALAMDLLECPHEIHQALAEVDQAWLHYWNECNRPLLPRQHGYVDWLGVWSDRPAVTVECDFSCMISPQMFDEFFIPSLRRQTEWVERTIYHLDGPGAVRHLDALLALERLTGIQWVPGAGGTPMLEWLDLLKRIQDAGKLLVIHCLATEVEPLLAELKPQGLFLQTRCATAGEADDLVRKTLSLGR